MPVKLTADFPEKLGVLFKPSRYKVLYGGRGGAKSWGVARALLILGRTKPLRIICAREIQKSIAESVHKLLADQVKALELQAFYEVQQTVIRGQNGTEFTFHGLKHNVQSIKSAEGCDIVWVEEAQVVSKTSWDTLIPTIRKEGSEIWMTLNPELEEDETYQRFVLNPPTNATVIKINWRDNPWFPRVLREEKDALKERDPDAYLHVWEGECRQTLEGAIYAEQMRLAAEEGRFARVPYDASRPVYTFWDLGWADKTAIVLAQSVGSELHVIDYIENRQKPLNWYLSELQGKGYIYAVDWLPHDARSKTLAADMSVEGLLRKAGRQVQIVPRMSIEDGINAARTVFNRVWFDQSKCADLLQCLRHYRYEVDPDTGKFSGRPLHDDYSNGADAFRYFAICSSDLAPREKPRLTFETQFTHGVALDAPGYALEW